MKKILLLLIVPCYLLMVAGFTCNDSGASTGEAAKASFWKKNETAETYYLYIDNVEKGMLPFLPDSTFTKEHDKFEKEAISMLLKPGSYKITAKDKTGNIYCEGTLFLKRTTGSTEVHSSWDNDKCEVKVVYGD